MERKAASGIMLTLILISMLTLAFDVQPVKSQTSPTASFTYSPQNPYVGETVTFDASASYDPDGTIVSYVWNLGDGGTGSGMVITHAYATADNYSVSLTVTDNDALTDTTMTLVIVEKLSSTISIIASPTTMIIGEYTSISGSITPIRAAVDVTIQYRLSGAEWGILTSLLTDGNGQYSYDWTPLETGTHELKAIWMGDVATFGAESSILAITVLSMPVHDIAVTAISVSSTEVLQGETVTIDAIVQNKGDFTETFDVILYYDSTAISTMTVTNLVPGATKTLASVWNTAGVAEGNYIIKAVATIAVDADPANNILVTTLKVLSPPPTPTQKLSIKLTGEFDYLLKEPVKIKMVALVRDASTMEPISDADVTIQIYDDADNLWISSVMIEKLTGTGIYEWTSSGTIKELGLKKGIYLVRAQASFEGGPQVHDVLLFHIDPPSESSVPPLTPLVYYLAAISILIAGATIGITLGRRRRRLRVA